METRKRAFQFWTGNPHRDWRNTVQVPETQFGGLVKAWWMVSCLTLYWNWWQCRIDPDYSETTSWGGHRVLSETEQRTWVTYSMSPNTVDLTSLATWQIYSVIQRNWRSTGDVLTGVETVAWFDSGASGNNSQICDRLVIIPASPFSVGAEMNLGFHDCAYQGIRWL